jgi:glycosyltransferase involved in cell wall biosynthesis
MGYFLAALPETSEGARYRVIDTRGPWFLGGAPWRVPLSIIYLAVAALRVAWAGVFRRRSLLHVNITGRGSTVRKLLITAIARVVSLPYLLHIHDYDYGADVETRSGLMRRFVRSMFIRAEEIIVLGVGAERKLRTALSLQDTRVLVLPNAVPDPYRRSGSEVCISAVDAVRLVFLGYLSARKGVPELLDALATPEMAALPWRATLAGGGPVDAFRKRAAALGIADRVAFPGWIGQSEASALCATADILVLPSHAEGLAMSVLEGLAHGLAVVTTPVGAHAETIVSEKSGLLTPPGDVSALAAALVRLVRDPELRERLRTGARQRFLDRFDVRIYSTRLASVHLRLLDSRRLTGKVQAESLP